MKKWILADSSHLNIQKIGSIVKTVGIQNIGGTVKTAKPLAVVCRFAGSGQVEILSGNGPEAIRYNLPNQAIRSAGSWPR